tara:strand:+ start:572 stop:1525 length:954 start_codon:yes stop_codon:yes gene_type:complete
LGLVLVVPVLGGLFLVSGVKAKDFEILEFHPLWCVAAFLAYLGSHVVRSVRMLHLEEQARVERVGALPISAMLAVHQAANHILPMRLGEFTYATLMRAVANEGFSKSLGATALMRFADFLGLGVMVIWGVALAPFTDPRFQATLFLAGFGALFMGIGGLWFGDRLVVFLSKPIRWIFGARFDSFLGDLSEALGIWRRERRSVVLIAVESIVLWFALLCLNLCLARGVGMEIGWAAMSIGFLGSVILSFVPVGTVMNLGTIEAGFVLTLSMVGFETKEAVTYGMGIHMGLIVTTGVAGIVGGLWLLRNQNSTDKPPPT